MAGSYESGIARQDASWKLPTGWTANRDCRLELEGRFAVAADRSGSRPGRPVGRSAGFGVRGMDQRVGWRDAQGLAASLGEPHPLGAGMNQATAGEGQGDGSTDRPARDH